MTRFSWLSTVMQPKLVIENELAYLKIEVYDSIDTGCMTEITINCPEVNDIDKLISEFEKIKQNLIIYETNRNNKYEASRNMASLNNNN